MNSREEAYKTIADLTERFNEQIASYKKSDYNETLVRRDFLDPFFKALGWDVDNSQGYAEAYREVIHEDRLKVSGGNKAPDYSFRLPGGKRLFFVEAKRPSVYIKEDIVPAYQVRRYGWSAKLPVSIVTDFEEFALYDCIKKPVHTDKASTARIKYFTYKDYLNEFDFLWDTFSKERVLRGGLDKFVVTDKLKKGTATVDREFLNSLDEWRKELALNIALRNEVNNDELNFVVQALLDRLIFLRIAEDRNIETYGALKNCIISIGGEKNLVYTRLLKLFTEADSKYNSGMFNFRQDTISSKLEIDNTVLRRIIQQLYYPESPYEFSVINVEILGSAYEQFLGKQITLKGTHKATIEEKPEVRKAGGVYYTPQYIVDYIVDNTVGKLIDSKTPVEVTKIKIVDPACGSGSFLLGAYDKLLKWYHAYYHPEYERLTSIAASKEYNLTERNKAIRDRNKLPLTPEGRLTTNLKKKILTDNMYGVDIDANAVEVTKLSLLLKCLEDETQSSINAALRFGETVLPSLENNIRVGNSLIDVDFYEQYPDADTHAIKPFSWKDNFKEVFSSLRGTKQSPESGFDVVIGNPPYVRQEMLSDQKPYLQQHYAVYHGMADLYTYFIERGISILKPDGLFGIIVANKWMRANYGEPLRRWLKEKNVGEIIDFGDLPVFQKATTYPCILIVDNSGVSNPSFSATKVDTLNFTSLKDYIQERKKNVAINSLGNDGWNLSNETEKQLLKKLHEAGVPLGEYVKGKIYRGVLTGLNEAFVIDEVTKDALIKKDERSAEIIKPFLAGRDIKRYQSQVKGSFLILFPKGFTNNKGNRPKNAWKWLSENYNAIAKHLEPYKEAAEKRYDKGEYWWELRTCDYYNEFEKPKIIIPAIVQKASYAYDVNKFYSNDKTSIIPTDDLFLLGIMNSKACDHYIKSIASTKQGGYFEYKPMYVSKLPIAKANKKQKEEVIKYVDIILQLNQQLQQTTLPQQQEQLKQRIAFTDKKIDALVYELYGLSEQEVGIVEGNNKSK